MDLLILIFTLSYQNVMNINHNVINIGVSLYKNINMKLIYIKSTMEPKNYSTIRSILKKEQGEKIAPYIFKLTETKSLQAYLNKERITYEVYQEERVFKRMYENSNQESSKKRNL